MIRASKTGLDALTKGIVRDTPGLIALLVLSNGCSVLINILLIRKGGPALSDGVFNIMAIFSVALYAAYLGIPQAMTKLIAQATTEAESPELASLLVSCFSALAVSGILACAVMWIYSESLPAGALVGENFLPICIWLLSVVVLKAVSGCLQGFLRVGHAMWYEQSLEILRLAVLAAALPAGLGARGILWGWALVSLAYAAAGLILLRTSLATAAAGGPSASVKGGESASGKSSSYLVITRRLLPLGFCLFLPAIGNFAAIGAITMALAGTERMGQVTAFAICTQIPSLLILAAFPMGALLLPAFARRAAEGGKGIAKAAGEILMLTSAVQLALAALLALACPWIIQFLFSGAYLDTVIWVRWLCAAYALEALKHAIDPALISLGMAKRLACLEGLRIAAAAGLAVPVAQRWGLGGCVILLAGVITGAFLGRLALFLPALSGRPREPVLD